jgi:hypothetical protein
MAGSAGSSGFSGGGSAGNGGSAGSGSSAGAPVVHPPCPQGVLFSAAPLPDPRVRETHAGLNGSFTDTCENGDLVQYDCETSTITGPDNDPATYTSFSGQVVSKNVDCGGRCQDGACPNTCLAEGDTLRCLSVEADGHATFESLSGGFTYACDINSLVVCEAMPEPGATVTVFTATRLSTGVECVNEVGFAVEVGTQGTCWYYPCIPTAR